MSAAVASAASRSSGSFWSGPSAASQSMIALTSAGDRSVQSGIRCCLNCWNNAVAVGSPRLITLCDERTKGTSHVRARRVVTPFRSGPTFTPLPNVWHAVQRVLKTFFGSSACALAGAMNAISASTSARRATPVGASNRVCWISPTFAIARASDRGHAAFVRARELMIYRRARVVVRGGALDVYGDLSKIATRSGNVALAQAVTAEQREQVRTIHVRGARGG